MPARTRRVIDAARCDTPSTAEPTFRARLMNAALRAAEASGQDALQLLADAGIEPQTRISDGRVPHSTSERLYTLAAEAAGDPAYGLRIGAGTDAFDHGELSMLWMMATSGVELLEMQRRFACFWHDSLRVDWERDEHELRVLLSFGAWSVSRVVEDAIMSGILHRARGAVGQDFAPLAIWLTSPEPAVRAPYDAFFRCPVYFAKPSLAVVLPAAYLDLKVPAGAVNALVAQAVRAQLEAARPSEELAEQIKRVLRRASGASAWTSDALSKQLGLSKKTLERRLAEASTSFRVVVNALRFELARDALHGDDKLETIADTLGFSDLRSFTRAFKRWTGATPSAYRGQVRSERQPVRSGKS